MKKTILALVTTVTLGITNFAQADIIFPVLRLDGSGNGYAVWLNSPENSGQYVLQTTRASSFQIASESTWQTTNLEEHTGVLATTAIPGLGVNSSGDAALLWLDQSTTTSNIVLFGKIRPAISGEWSATAAEIEFDGTVLSIVNLSINDSGQIIALVTAYTDPFMADIAEYIVTTTIADNNVWSAPIRISPE